MKYIKYFILSFIILFLNSNVFAYETKTIYGATDGNWANQTLSQSGKVVYNANTYGSQTIVNVGSTVSDANYGMYFGIYNTIVAGKSYNVKINFNDYDVRRTVDYSYIHINNNSCIIQAYKLVSTNSSGNGKTIQLTFNCPSPSNAVYFQIWKESEGYYFVTTVNWRLNSVQIEEADDVTQNIINNQTQNTQNIINNSNENTQDIIENQNQNTQDMIDSQKVCNNIEINKSDIEIDGKFLNSSGNETQSQNYGITKYVNIENTKLYVLLEDTIVTNAYMCFYNSNKVLISCSIQDNLTLNQEIVPPTNTVFARFTISKLRDRPQFTMKSCKDGNQAVSDDINELNDTIKDDNIGSATSDAGDFITGFDTNTFGLTSIITAPLNLIQSITSSTCTDLQIPLPYLNNKKLILPCMTPIYQSTFGSLFTLYQTITFGIIAYWICVRIFNMVKDFKNPDHDEIEVVDL